MSASWYKCYSSYGCTEISTHSPNTLVRISSQEFFSLKLLLVNRSCSSGYSSKPYKAGLAYYRGFERSGLLEPQARDDVVARYISFHIN